MNRLKACELCPRQCGVDRLAGEPGFCGAGRVAQVYRYGAHTGEEPPISGTRGAGTVFFSRCTLRCLYCQNYPWSQEGAGRRYDTPALASVFEELAQRGCHNWDLVSPTPWLSQIAESLQLAKNHGTSLPVVYNTSGYERHTTLDWFGEHIDVYLTDLRYAEAETAWLGSQSRDYADVARAALLQMWRTHGPLDTDDQGVARRGVICRILVLPGHSDEAIANLRWIAENIGTEVTISLMSQYTPAYKAVEEGHNWARPVAPKEYEVVCEVMRDLGFERGWMQELEETRDDLIGYHMPPGGTEGTGEPE